MNTRIPTDANDRGIDTQSAEMERVLQGGFRTLRFPAALEAQFEARQRQVRDRHVIVMSLIGIIVQNCFLFTDAVLIPDVFGRALELRLGWVTGCAMLGLLPLALRPPVWLRETLVAACTLLIAGAILYLSSISTAPTAVYHPVGLVLIPMFACIALRLRFWYALSVSVLTLVAAVVVIRPTTPLAQVVAQTNDLVLAAGILFTVLACYRLEQQERRNFLMAELDRRHRDALTAANVHLHDLTTLDPLTGIYNRRQFEAMLDLLWKQALDSARPLALLMIDVDAFKTYNDRYGHPEGDACLKRIASCLSRTAERESVLVARIGGDEFAALGLGLDTGGALALGHALHDGVAGMAIPHRHSPVAPTVSLSIGAVSLRPQTWERPQELIDLADRAVYEAKAAGRNCVRGAGPVKPTLQQKGVVSLVGGRDHPL